MANNMRWRWGETNPVCVDIGQSVAVEIGDLVYLDSGSVYPASHLTYSGTLSANQTSFGGKFLGVSMQAKPSGLSGKIRVATSGVFSFDCASSTFSFGDLVAPTANSASTAFENQKIAATTTPAAAVGRVVRAESANTTSVYIQICSSVIGTRPASSSASSSASPAAGASASSASSGSGT